MSIDLIAALLVAALGCAVAALIAILAHLPADLLQ